MKLDLSFVYYRNFRFDGKLHVRCTGKDLDKVARIRYELERGSTPHIDALIDGISSRSQARTGKLADHGCPATFHTDGRPGVYRITPRVILLDSAATALNRPLGAAGVIDLAPLVVEVKEGESERSILDKVPLDGAAGRRRRAAQEREPATPSESASRVVDPFGQAQAPFPYRPQGQQYPGLVIKFHEGGYERLLADMEPDSGSLLVRTWPGLKAVLAPQPLLNPEERQDARLGALREYCYLAQPDTMLNDTYVDLVRTLAALEYVKSLHFFSETEPGVVWLGISAVLATIITGTAVVFGNRAHEKAKPTPDFEAMQHYLDEPGASYQGLNVRKTWAKGVTGKGARIHFSDGGIYPNHEDLRGNPNFKIVRPEPNDDPDHGTASVGVMLAMRNGIGMTGISHDCELFLYDNRAEANAERYATPKELLLHVEPGDIVGINRQTANIDVLHTFLPSLHDQVWWDVCQALTRRGAVVLNAAANGSAKTNRQKGTTQDTGVDLSQWPYFTDHGDADAILVGACQFWDGKPMHFSNHSYRYRMLNAWGIGVATLGYGALQDKPGHDRDYTDNYSGTSSATPMTTGALALIQSYAIEQHHVYLNANQMHLLVMASGYKDATVPDTDVLPMGARPNVHGALVMLDRILGGGRFHPARGER